MNLPLTSWLKVDPMRKSLPQQGTAWPELANRMRDMARGDVDWRRGRAAVYVFDPGEDVLQVQREAYAMFMAENGLGPRAFPSLAQMEREVVGFGLGLLHAPEGAGGSMTSGGSESIFLAVKTARDHATSLGRDMVNAEIVVPYSAHPAFDKAAHIMRLKVIRVPLQDNLMPDVTAMAAAITPRTFMIVGSAPCFPYGLIEPIGELSDLALAHGLWLHVDSCVGGYFAPFAAMNGVELPPFDFRVPGVCSMSADLHKFGYAAKGASTVLYRDGAMRDFQIFRNNAWPNGMMETPTLAGTRPGGAIASAWAVMNYLGVEGYCARARIVVETRQRMEAGVRALGFSVRGNPQLMIFTFGSDSVDPLLVGEKLFARGWFSGRTIVPRGIHMMLSPGQAKVADEWLAALAAARDEALASDASATAPVSYA